MLAVCRQLYSYRQINSPTDATILQNDLKELENWEKVHVENEI